MWVTDVLQKLIPHFESGKGSHELLNTAQLKALQVGLLKYGKISPEQAIRRSEDSFVELLCEIKVNLDSGPEQAGLQQLQPAMVALSAELDQVLSKDLTFSQSKALESSLDKLLLLHRQHSTKTQWRRRQTRSLTLLVSLIPLLAYGVHWTIGNYYQQALLDEVDFVYPEDTFSYEDGAYTMNPALTSQTLEDFATYFFQDGGYYESNPLPLAFNAQAASAKGVELDPDSRLAQALESGVVSPRDLNDRNLMMVRIFVRNIKDSNIVNRLRVEARRVSENTFPWHKLDLDTSLHFRLNHGDPWDSRPSLTVTTEQRPVTDLQLDIRAETNRPDTAYSYSHSQEQLLKSRWIQPDFGVELTALSARQPSFTYVDPEHRQQLKLDPELLRTPRQIEKMLSDTGYHALSPGDNLSQDSASTQLPGGAPYIYSNCADGGLALLASGSQQQALLDLPAIQALDIQYRYKLLNGKLQTGQERVSLGESMVALVGSFDNQKLEDCIGSLAFLFMDLPPTAAGPGGWANQIDKLALALMDQTEQASPVIAVEKTLFFDFQDEPESLKQSSDEIHILTDGDYVLFNLLVSSFPGGDYRFSIYFDDEEVAQFTVNLLWPQTLHFKPGDEKYFRKTAGKTD